MSGASLAARDGYALITDTCADLPAEFVKTAGLEVLSFPYTLDGEHHVSLPGDDMSGFYDAMRTGSAPTTASIPLGEYAQCFSTHAASGTEVVFLAFSSGLSSSFESAVLARDKVLERHPDARVRIVDTLRASVAQGALVAEAVRRRDAGATAEELETWTLEARSSTQGYFTAESLEHLRRGGRVSDVTAAAGAMLDIRPVLTFSDDGGLRVDRLVRGRRRSLRSLAEKVAEAPGEAPQVMVGHAHCAEDAERLEAMIAEVRPDATMVRCEIGPVIGSHTGPGMLAVAFVGA